jgi:hypothetical protein
LLDIDCAEATSREPFSAYAFCDEVPSGESQGATFKPIDALMLWLGLDLLEMGFRDQDVLYLLRSVRPLALQRFGPSLIRSYQKVDVSQLIIAPKVVMSERSWSTDARPFFVTADKIPELALSKNVRTGVMLAVGLAADELAKTLTHAPEVQCAAATAG